MSNTELFFPAQNFLGEGPLWNVDEQALYWVDIMGEQFHRLDPRTMQHESFDVGTPVCVLAFRKNGGLAMAVRDGFAYWNAQEKRPEYIVRPLEHLTSVRFNDGAVDCAGRFWAGTMSTTGDLNSGVLYRLDPDGSLHVMDTGFGITNGLGWSPDNTIMYLTDSPRRVIYAYDFAATTGAISNKRVFVQLPDGPAQPDGLAVDSQGYIWSAHWGGGCITRYAPDGSTERVIQVAAPHSSACVFGGPTLTNLYITSAQQDLSQEQLRQYPLSGDLFHYQSDVPGLPKFQFAG